jgi:intein/homing endonuclease
MINSGNKFQSGNFFMEKKNNNGLLVDLDNSKLDNTSDNFKGNLNKWFEFVGYLKWYPDLFWDLITPETGGIKLDLDQRVFLRSEARFGSGYYVFSRGYGKCISGDSILFTNKGMIEIGSLFDYNNSGVEKIYNHSIDVIDVNCETVNSNKGIYSGLKPTINIITKEGYSIEGTYIHPLLVMSPNGKFEYKLLKDLSINDYVCINRKNNIFGNNLDIDKSKILDEYVKSLSKQKSSHLYIRELPSAMNEDIAYYLGLLIGDGCLTIEHRIIFSNKDEDILKKYFSISKNIFKVKNVRHINDSVDYVVADVYLKKYLDLIGVSNADSHNKIIPNCIMVSSKNCVSAFIKGLFDTDGTVDNRSVSYTTVSFKLAKQVQVILLNYGIISNLYKKTDKNGRISYRITITGNNVQIFMEEIGFLCQYKKEKGLSLIRYKYNPNIDVIPYQRDRIRKIHLAIPRGNRTKFGKLNHTSRLECDLTYNKLAYLLKLMNDGYVDGSLFEYYNDLMQKHYFYSKIKEIKYSKNDVYDIQVPNTNSFVANGFINHNTFLEVMSLIHTAIFYPAIDLSLTAQTQEQSAKLLEDKYKEIIKFYPLIKEEIFKANFNKDTALIEFNNGSTICNLTNSQNSKGLRKKRLKIEESALLNDSVFQDALEPIVEIPRLTVGKNSTIDPNEMNWKIDFYTTAGYKNSTEYYRLRKMLEEMTDLKGSFVLGASWELANFFGRGSPRSKIMEKKEKNNPIFFAQNYESEWVGASNGALVNTAKLLDCRVLLESELKAEPNCEYVLGVDVARSDKSNNCQTSINIIKITRNTNGKIKSLNVPNIITYSSELNFTAQSIEIKRIKERYNAKIIVIDDNGLGIGLSDALLKEDFDPLTGKSLGCWNTINTNRVPEIRESEKCLYCLKAQSFQSEIAYTFTELIESGKVKLLQHKDNAGYDVNDKAFYSENILPFIQTDFLIDEIFNLQLVENEKTKKLSIESVVKKMNKDRFSGLAYALWYIKSYMDYVVEDKEDDIDYLKKFCIGW